MGMQGLSLRKILGNAADVMSAETRALEDIARNAKRPATPAAPAQTEPLTLERIWGAEAHALAAMAEERAASTPSDIAPLEVTIGTEGASAEAIEALRAAQDEAKVASVMLAGGHVPTDYVVADGQAKPTQTEPDDEEPSTPGTDAFLHMHYYM